METLPLIEYTPLGIAALTLFILLFVLRSQLNQPKQFNKEILEELQLMNQNHFNAIVSAVNDASHELSETIHDDNTKIIQLLGEIKGGLGQL